MTMDPTYLRFIRVQLFKIDSFIVPNVIECISCPSASAPQVAEIMRTIHQILNAQLDQLTRLLEILPFQ